MRGEGDSSEMGITCGVAVRHHRFEDCSHVQNNKKTSQKRKYCHEQKQYKKQMIVKRKVLQRLFAGICSNRFSVKIWRNVIFLEITFINYFE